MTHENGEHFWDNGALHWELRTEIGENDEMLREEHLALRIENCERVRLGYSENKRIRKVKINTSIRIENRHEIFNLIWNSKTLRMVLSENREHTQVKMNVNCESRLSKRGDHFPGL